MKKCFLSVLLCFVGNILWAKNESYFAVHQKKDEDTTFYFIEVFWDFNSTRINHHCFDLLDSLANIALSGDAVYIIEVYQSQNPILSSFPLHRRLQSILEYFAMKKVTQKQIFGRYIKANHLSDYRKDVIGINLLRIEEKHNSYSPIVLIGVVNHKKH